MFTAKFLGKLLRESLISFVVASGGAVLVTSGSIGRDVVVGAAVAGLRAVVGVLVKDFGEEKDTPSV